MFRESSKPKDLQSARSLNHDLVVPGAVEVVAPLLDSVVGFPFLDTAKVELELLGFVEVSTPLDSLRLPLLCIQMVNGGAKT